MAKILTARSPAQIEHVRALFTEYAASPGCSKCFRDFDKEVAELPGEYAAPEGRLLLALHRRKPAGCVGLSKADDGAAKMKRLYVRPQFRGKGIGRALAAAVIEAARESGYERMRLYTFPFMREAIALYRTLGFKRVRAEGCWGRGKPVCMELALR
jgi:carbonic anhydrase